MSVQPVEQLEHTLQQSKNAFLTMATLSTAQKNQALAAFADIIAENVDFLLAENEKDIQQARQDDLTASLYQRLKLDTGKIAQLVQGILDLITLPDPAGQLLSATKLD